MSETSGKTFKLRLTKKEWDDQLRGWSCSALKIPGADVTEIFSEGERVNKDLYQIDLNNEIIRWPLGEPPETITVIITLTRNLTTQEVTARWKKAAIVLPVLTALLVAYFNYARERPHSPPNPNGNSNVGEVHQPSPCPSPTSDLKAISVKITEPTAFAERAVPHTNGVGTIAVSGTSQNVYDTDLQIYACSHVFAPHDDKDCWFDSPAKVNRDGTWTAVVFAGDPDEYPITKAPAGTSVKLHAVVATPEEVQAAIKSHQKEKYFSDISAFKIQAAPVTVTIRPQ